MQDTKWGWLSGAVLAQFGSEIAAGKHDQYPALKRIWLDHTAAKLEREAHYQACVEVAQARATGSQKTKQGN